MVVRSGLAKFVSAAGTMALKKVFRRPAANFPGKVALYVDPRIIAHTASRLKCGSICVVGTNGKTTITNMIADCLEDAGMTVVCNRTGANLDSGVATSLLQAKAADWGVFESDELWLAKTLPQLQSTYVLLLNLFRDQLDRVGEIDNIQDSIQEALAASPETVLIYNADDPLCERIARGVSNRKIAFGVGEDLGLPQNTVFDARMCQQCDHMLEYRYRQYGQLGDYHCPGCGFGRSPLQFVAQNCRIDAEGMSFDVIQAQQRLVEGGQALSVGAPCAHIDAAYSGAYMIYNLLAVYVAAHAMGAQNDAIQRAISAFDPQNGRLQNLRVNGRDVLLNLAKNPTGFNQNLKLISQAQGCKVVAFFVNDKEGDGRDISWIWDIDFEELAQQPDLLVYAGGIRKNDLQVRLKYAGLRARLVEDADDVMEQVAKLPVDYRVYVIANYTALPPVRESLAQMARESEDGQGAAADVGGFTVLTNEEARAAAIDAEDAERTDAESATFSQATIAAEGFSDGKGNPAKIDRPLRIVHLFPDLLNLYGDGGNVKVLQKRCLWRGIPVEVVDVNYSESVDLADADIVFMGGGPDREQQLASTQLQDMRESLRDYVERDGVLLAICGGYQILGPSWIAAGDEIEGLGLLDIETRRVHAKPERLIGDIVVRSPLADHDVVGYENHAGRTYLGHGMEAFGAVVGGRGKGNNDSDAADGATYRNVVATYLHGPLLGKNPEVADALIELALRRRLGHDVALMPLDDSVEFDANAYMSKRLGI